MVRIGKFSPVMALLIGVVFFGTPPPAHAGMVLRLQEAGYGDLNVRDQAGVAGSGVSAVSYVNGGASTGLTSIWSELDPVIGGITIGIPWCTSQFVGIKIN